MEQTKAAAFDALVMTSGTRLLRTCYLLTGDRALAEDLLQTALTTTYLRWDSIRDVGSAEGYVRAVAANTATKWWQRKWRGEVPTETLPEGAVGNPYAGIDERTALRRALLILPPKQRAAVVLRFFDDLGENETAAALGVSVGTVKSRTARGLERLRADPNVVALFDDISERSSA